MLVRKQKAQIYTNEKFDTTIGKHFEILPLKDFSNGLKNANKVIFNPSTINYRDFTLIKSKAQESPKDFIKEAKAIKNSAEIEHFKKNFERTDNVVNKAFMLTQTRKNLTELDLSDAVEKEYIAQGANQLSFKTILAAGAILHYPLFPPVKQGQNKRRRLCSAGLRGTL